VRARAPAYFFRFYPCLHFFGWLVVIAAQSSFDGRGFVRAAGRSLPSWPSSCVCVCKKEKGKKRKEKAWTKIRRGPDLPIADYPFEFGNGAQEDQIQKKRGLCGCG